MLHTAASNDNQQLAKLLIAHGADVNQHAEKGGPTPLIIAAGKSHLEMSRLLVRNGADPDFRDDRGVSALMCAALSAMASSTHA